ncbi:MAG: hypothetical protein OEZ34_01465 [Spirochaetia bacterium]|nr:hypothetical protein [Spirochaetia bacterium]
MKSKSYILVFSFISAGLVLSCTGNRKKDDSQQNHLYTDSKKGFQMNIPAGLEKKESSAEGITTLEFPSEDDEGVTQYIIRIRLIEGEADLFSPLYEASFLSRCKCSIKERGSVQFAGRPARHYIVSLRNGEWLGIQRHIPGKGKILIVSITGPVSGHAELKVLFDQISSSFRFLEKQ